MSPACRRTGGFDWFRLPAALLVAAVHTGPLLSLSTEANDLLTDVLARLAVPFFFAVTGYFLLPRRTERGVLARFLKKTALLYGLSTLLYLPVLAYSGYFQPEGLPGLLARDLIFDGTFYHLWYFPAVLLGTLLCPLFLGKLGARGAAVLCGVLYGLGLLGDSYYALTAALPPLRAAYDVLFHCFTYTRNGLFFAPLFLLLGGALARREEGRSAGRLGLALLLSLAALTVEGLVIRRYALARFDALYLSLPVCVWFLLRWLRALDLPERPKLRPFTGAFYILHPLCIVLVRGGAKILGLTGLLVENSLMHYAAVVLLAALLSLPFAVLPRRHRSMRHRDGARAWIELDTAALRHNLDQLGSLLPQGCALMAVVKANAYGHGDLEVARICRQAGVEDFAVATAEEGVRLRQSGVRGLILVLGYSGAEAAPLLARFRLTQTVVSGEHARLLDRTGFPIQVHCKVDTGMHRLGVSWADREELQRIYTTRNLRVTGMFTHLAAAERLTPEDQARTREQVRRFYAAAGVVQDMGLSPGALHIQSSYGLLNYGQLPCAYVRAGIALYGVLSAPGEHTALTPRLHPVLSLRARVVQVRTLESGVCAGYDGSFTAEGPSVVAVVGLGYADGYPRSLSCGAGGALVRGRYAPVAGRICMDQLLLDVTGIPGVAPGDVATFIGRDGDRVIAAEEAAQAAGTITNELLSRLGPRLERI